MSPFNYSTKDMDLSERLQKEGFTVIKISKDPVDGLLKHTFEETVNEVNKILGINPKKEEVENSGEVKKVGRPKKKRG